jgi:WSC domain
MGNPLETCGGSVRLSVFQLSAVTVTATTTSSSASSTATGPAVGSYTYYGCQTEGTDSRALSAKSYAADGMTLESCETFCSGYNYFGTEYARECYCGNTFSIGSVPASPSDCNFPCMGNPGEICGAGLRLSVYQYNAGVAAVDPPTTPVPSLPNGWGSQGCWIDGVNGRILTHEENNNNGLTIESCVTICSGLGYTIAGLEWSVQCFCGNSIINGGELATLQTDCNMPCSGNVDEVCGAGQRMSIYSEGALTVVSPPAVQKTGLPGSWTYQGCLQ